MNATRRSRRVQMVVVLLLCAAPPCAEAEDFVCWPITQGDTVSGLARRLTGDDDRAYSEAFQIRDPARAMFVPKSHYRRLRPEWEVCVARAAVKSELLAPAPPVPAPEETIENTTQQAIDQPSPAVSIAAPIAVAVLLTLSMCSVIAGYVVARPIPKVMRRAGEEFISEFARPLIDLSSPAPPIAARLRFIRYGKQLEIGIAPGDGRRYPNLTDHKHNVEYDVDRVMRRLGSGFVVSDRPRAAGKWVMVRIRLADRKQAGVT